MRNPVITILYFFIFTFCFIPCSAEKKQIHILSVNDMHSQIDGMPKLKALVNKLRKDDPELIVLSCGDNRTGNPYNDVPVSVPMVKLMNNIGFDATAVGNHEWDSHQEGFRNVINNSNFPHICANVFVADSTRIHIFPYKIFCRKGVKIGILGGIQINSANIPDAHPDNMKGIRFKHIDEVIPRYKWMRDQVDVLILLSHDGYEVDTITAKKFPFLDAIIGGHSHIIADNEYYAGVLVNQADCKLRKANLTTFEVEDGKVISKKSELINLEKFNEEDAEVRAMVESFKTDPEMKKVLSHVISPFQRKEELANMLMDAMREELSVDVAIQNGGGVRYSTFPIGDFTVADLLELDPFGNNAVIYEMTGKELEDFIMNALDVDEKQPAFISGCSYVMDIQKGATKDETHPTGIKITMDGKKKFSKTAKYKVATNHYAAKISTSTKQDQGTVLPETCESYVRKWLLKHPELNYTGSKRIQINTR